MPNIHRTQTVYLHTGNPDTVNTDTLLRPGELGVAFDKDNKVYQVVKLDSGATAAPTVGVVAANQLAFWKDRSAYLVTNDKRFALLGGIANSFANNVAGVFRTAVTAGNYCCVLQKGYNVAVSSDGSTTTAGDYACADLTADTAKIRGETIATAPTYQNLGVVRTTEAANVAYVDLDIPSIP